MMISLLDLARRIEDGTLSPAAALAEQLDAIDRMEPDIQAFKTRAPREVVLQQAGQVVGPLSGCGLGVKDIFDTAELPTQMGSQLYRDHQPRFDAPAVHLARHAGAVVVGKTVTTEFAFFSPGPTRNPHHLGHTPGGSSSGSAAAVAAGMIPFALGTQTGGSVIRPAAFCGVAGYKPSFARVPTAGVKCFSWSLDTVGFFAASVADVAYGAGAVMDRDLRVDTQDASVPRIGLVSGQPWEAAHPDMLMARDRLADAARQAGAHVVDVTLGPPFARAFSAHGVIQDHEAAQALSAEWGQGAAQLSPILRETLQAGRQISPVDFDAARAEAAAARRALGDLFAGVDVLLDASAPGVAPAGLASTGSSVFNRLWTLMGTPCVNVPGLTDAQGLPLGLQVIGLPSADRATLQAAHWLEGLMPR